jgi:hypothetical protein
MPDARGAPPLLPAHGSVSGRCGLKLPGPVLPGLLLLDAEHALPGPWPALLLLPSCCWGCCGCCALLLGGRLLPLP